MQEMRHGELGGTDTKGATQITPDEVRCIVSGFEDASNLYAEGLKIGGVKHMLIKATEDNIHAKKGSAGVICCKTGQCVLIAAYSEEIKPEGTNAVVERLADYLRNVGY